MLGSMRQKTLQFTTRGAATNVQLKQKRHLRKVS